MLKFKMRNSPPGSGIGQMHPVDSGLASSQAESLKVFLRTSCDWQPTSVLFYMTAPTDADALQAEDDSKSKRCACASSSSRGLVCVMSTLSLQLTTLTASQVTRVYAELPLILSDHCDLM